MVRIDRGELAWEGRRVVVGDGTSVSLLMLGEGPMLLLVHGGLSQAALWAWVARALAEDHRVVLMDRRNSGHSGWSDQLGVDVEAGDVVAVLEALGPAAAVVGHSYGEHPFQDTVRALDETMPDTTVQVLDGQRHLATIGASEQVAESIRSFVSSSSAASAAVQGVSHA